MEHRVDYIHGLDSRFQQLTSLHEAFGFLLDATSLMSYDDSNSDVEGLHQKYRALAVFFCKCVSRRHRRGLFRGRDTRLQYTHQ